MTSRGLRTLRRAVNWTQINSGEYLDLPGKRVLLDNHGVDILNVHGQVTDVMRIGWLAAELGVPICLGNAFLEIGVHMATALPEVEWLEYSFENFDHLVKRPSKFATATLITSFRASAQLPTREAAVHDEIDASNE
jgi:hypothetical protein